MSEELPVALARLEERLRAVSEAIARIETGMASSFAVVNKRVEDLDARVNKRVEDLDARVKHLEAWRGRVIGAASVVTFLAGLLGVYVGRVI